MFFSALNAFLSNSRLNENFHARMQKCTQSPREYHSQSHCLKSHLSKRNVRAKVALKQKSLQTKGKKKKGDSYDDDNNR